MEIKRLKALRTEQRLTQIEVANILGISNKTYCTYERGTREPDNDMLKKIAKFFGVSVDYLLGNETNIIEKDNLFTPEDYAQGIRNNRTVRVTAGEDTWLELYRKLGYKNILLLCEIMKKLFPNEEELIKEVAEFAR